MLVATIMVGELVRQAQLPALVFAIRLRKPLPVIAGILAATAENYFTCLTGE